MATQYEFRGNEIENNSKSANVESILENCANEMRTRQQKTQNQQKLVPANDGGANGSNATTNDDCNSLHATELQQQQSELFQQQQQ